MSDIEKRLKKYIDENLSHTDQYDSIVSKANLHPTKKESRVSFMKKNVLRFVLPCVIVLLLVVGIVVVTNLNSKVVDKKGEPVAVVQMDVNPSISIVIDENKVVLSCYGENNDGKMIINGEELVGKKLDEVIEKIITIEVNTGYLVSNSLEEINKISYQIESYKEDVLTDLEEKIKSKTTEICDKLNVNEKIDIVKEQTKSNLVERAMSIDPTLTKEAAEKMSSEELVKYIMGCQLEKATIPTVELENLYNNVKENRISFVEKEETKKVIDSLDNAYLTFKDQYSSLLDSLRNANDILNNVYYDNFVKSDSKYQEYLNNLKAAKKELLKLKEEVLTLEDGSIEKALKQAEIKNKESIITGLENTLEQSKLVVEGLINKAKNAVNVIIEQMESAYNELPSEIKTSLNEQLTNVENKVNEVKDNSFKYFEENYKELLENAISEAKEYKNSLIEQLK